MLGARNSGLVPNSGSEKCLSRPHLLCHNRAIRSRNLLQMSRKGNKCQNLTTAIAKIAFLPLLLTPIISRNPFSRIPEMVSNSRLGICLSRPHLFCHNRPVRSQNILQMSRGNKCQNLTTTISKIAFLPPPFPDVLS